MGNLARNNNGSTRNFHLHRDRSRTIQARVGASLRERFSLHVRLQSYRYLLAFVIERREVLVIVGISEDESMRRGIVYEHRQHRARPVNIVNILLGAKRDLTR